MPWWHEQPTAKSPNNTRDLWSTRHKCYLHMGVNKTNRSWPLPRCNGLNDYVPHKFIYWNHNLQSHGILSRAFGRWLSHEGGALMNGISALIKETPESFPFSSTIWRHSERTTTCEPESSYQTLNLPVPWSSASQPPELWAINFCCL